MEKEEPRGERKEGKTRKGGYEEEERGSGVENTGRKAKEGNVAGLEEKIDEDRDRGGMGDVLEAPAPFSAAPYSLFLSPRFVWFCFQSVDRRQHIFAASAALVRQMGRDRGPRPGTHALAGALGATLPPRTLRSSGPRSSRPPIGLQPVPGPEKILARGPAQPQGRAEPPNSARRVGGGRVV